MGQPSEFRVVLSSYTENTRIAKNELSFEAISDELRVGCGQTSAASTQCKLIFVDAHGTLDTKR